MTDSSQRLQHILWKMSKGKYGHSHLVDEEIEAYRGPVTCSRYHGLGEIFLLNSLRLGVCH